MTEFKDRITTKARLIAEKKVAEHARLLQEQADRERNERALGPEVARLGQEIVELLKEYAQPTTHLYERIKTGEQRVRASGLHGSRMEMRSTYAYQPAGIGWGLFDDSYMFGGELYGPDNRYGIDTSGRMYTYHHWWPTSYNPDDRIATDATRLTEADYIIEYISNTKAYAALQNEKLVNTLARKIVQ